MPIQVRITPLLFGELLGLLNSSAFFPKKAITLPYVFVQCTHNVCTEITRPTFVDFGTILATQDILHFVHSMTASPLYVLMCSSSMDSIIPTSSYFVYTLIQKVQRPDDLVI